MALSIVLVEKFHEVCRMNETEQYFPTLLPSPTDRRGVLAKSVLQTRTRAWERNVEAAFKVIHLVSMCVCVCVFEKHSLKQSNNERETGEKCA